MTPTLTTAPTDQRLARVMLVDDHPSFRATARWVLESEGYQIVAEAASGEIALDLAVAAAPDLVLLDIGLPGIDGFQVCSAIRARLPRARIVLISSRDLSDVGPDRVRACGAAGFVNKADLCDAALAAIVAPGTSSDLR